MTASLLRRLATVAVALSTTAAIAPAQTLLGDVTASGAGAFLCDVCTVSSTISVAAPGTVLGTGNNVTVRINGLTHSYFSDLFATLTYTPVAGPSITATLFDDIGGSGDPNGSFSFNGGFGGSVGSINYAGGDYAPAGSFDVFNGVTAAGEWTLTFVDEAGRDTGAFTSWDIGLATTAATTTAPEPGTWALMGTGLLGVAAAARRRRRA